MKLGVVGLGAAGLPVAVCLAQKHEVIGIDLDKRKVDGLNKKTYFGTEKEAKELLPKANLKATTKIEELSDVETIILALPSSSNDFSLITSVLEKLNTIYKGYVIISTTSPVGSTRNFQNKFKNLILAYIPMRTFEGKAIAQFYDFPHLVGVFEDKDFDLISKIYTECDCVATKATPEEAEISKLFSNTARQIEIAVANEFGHMCKLYDLDPEHVFKLVTEGDPHRKLKRPGIWAGKKPGIWGGFCLPKDTNMLVGGLALNRGYTPQLPEVAERIRIETIKRKADEIYYHSSGGPIGIMGITNKPIGDTTPDVRNSPVIDVIALLRQKGADILVYDPNISREELLEVANKLGVKAAKEEEVKKCNTYAVFENFDLQVKKNLNT